MATTSKTTTAPKSITASQVADTATMSRDQIAARAVSTVNRLSHVNLPGGETSAAPKVVPKEKPIAPTPPSATPQIALATAKDSGLPAPQSPGEARSAIQQFLPSAGASFYQPDKNKPQLLNSKGQPVSYEEYKSQGGQGVLGQGAFPDVQQGLPQNQTTQAVDQRIEQDPGYQQLLADRQEFTNIQMQHQSLTEEYEGLTKKLGIPKLNTQLMNMKNIIDGTEDDIRNEVTKAGGFATDSQVMALSFARNKQLVKNYNNLLETKQQAMETLNTMIGLAGQDRQFAMASVSQKMQIDQQIMEYKDKMQNNAQQTYQKLVDQIGFKGLYDSANGDPYYVSMIEKTLGLHPGGLAQLASIATQPDLSKMPTSYQEYVLAKQEGFNGTYNDYQNMDANRKATRNTTTNITYGQQQDQTLQADIRQTSSNLGTVVGPDGFISPQAWKRAYGDWLAAGHQGKDFIDNFNQYVNPSDPQDYGIKL